jgi:hypothetical protein
VACMQEPSSKGQGWLQVRSVGTARAAFVCLPAAMQLGLVAGQVGVGRGQAWQVFAVFMALWVEQCGRLSAHITYRGRPSPQVAGMCCSWLLSAHETAWAQCLQSIGTSAGAGSSWPLTSCQRHCGV